MYQTIQLSKPSTFQEDTDQLFSEAVFSGGKNKVTPIVGTIQKIKDKLDEEIEKQDKSYEASKNKKPDVKFDPRAFWRNTLFKDLEDQIGSVFGFRSVDIEPFVERYDSKEKVFESKVLNCIIWGSNRYPIEGLVTDDGFYDKSKSINISISISLGLIKGLEAEEILAVLLHEFGHGIDPALVDIRYTETNILSKYLTDRKGAINGGEKRFLSKHNVNDIVIIPIFGLLNCGVFGALADTIYKLFHGKDALMKKKAEKVRKMIANDKDHFDRQNFSEAFADNFARMYGYGPQLARGLQKMNKDNQKQIESRWKRERRRQDAIIEITKELLHDEHKTDIHRIRALIKEYDADISDPKTNPTVKKQLQEDMAELKKILDEYMNNFSDFQNHVNRVINDELDKIEVSGSEEEKDDEGEKKEEPKSKEEAIKEGFEFFDEKTNHEIAMERRKKREAAVTAEDREIIHKKYPGHGCSWARDKDGIYCFTHRCRSKSYPTVNDIPKKDVDFVVSTG